MPLKRIQEDVEKWTSQLTPQYWLHYEGLSRLTEEVREPARELNHFYGTKKKKANE